VEVKEGGGLGLGGWDPPAEGGRLCSTRGDGVGGEEGWGASTRQISKLELDFCRRKEIFVSILQTGA
jgi:hypothetical protein